MLLDCAAQRPRTWQVCWPTDTRLSLRKGKRFLPAGFVGRNHLIEHRPKLIVAVLTRVSKALEVPLAFFFNGF